MPERLKKRDGELVRDGCYHGELLPLDIGVASETISGVLREKTDSTL